MTDSLKLGKRGPRRPESDEELDELDALGRRFLAWPDTRLFCGLRTSFFPDELNGFDLDELYLGGSFLIKPPFLVINFLRNDARNERIVRGPPVILRVRGMSFGCPLPPINEIDMRHD